MLEGIVYLASSFWLGALHAATPGHGKTVAAAYLVGSRGRVVDAVALGLFVTLSHTGGLVAFAILATLGSSALLPQQAEGYLALGTGLLIVGIGLWMLWSQRHLLPSVHDAHPADHAHSHSSSATDHHSHEHPHDHHQHHDPDDDHHHRHGWGRPHSHRADLATYRRPSLGLLLGLGVAGGIAPDPAGLAVLLSAIASGKLVLGLLTVLVFSLGFATVLVVVGILAARAGRLVLDRIGAGRWLDWVQVITSVLIVGVGIYLSITAWRTLATFG